MRPVAAGTPRPLTTVTRHPGGRCGSSAARAGAIPSRLVRGEGRGSRAASMPTWCDPPGVPAGAQRPAPAGPLALIIDRRGHNHGTMPDPSPSVQPSGAPPITRRNGAGGHAGWAGARFRRGTQSGAAGLQRWERIGNGSGLRSDAPDAYRPLTCPNLNPGHLGSGLRTAPQPSASPALTRGLTWSFAWWQVQGSNLGRLSRRFYRPLTETS
jgi:hypothetical protein